MNKKIITFIGVSFFGFYVGHSSASAHVPGKINLVRSGHYHTAAVIYATPRVVVAPRAVVVVKKRKARLTRRIIRAAIRHR